MPPFCVSHENYSDLHVGSVQFNRITAAVCLKTGSAAEGTKRAEDALRAALRRGFETPGTEKCDRVDSVAFFPYKSSIRLLKPKKAHLLLSASK